MVSDLEEEEKLHRRVFDMLEDEVLNCYRYVEPMEGNDATYSIQFYRLHQEICRQVDSFFKFLMRKYGLVSGGEEDLSFDDYCNLRTIEHDEPGKWKFRVDSQTVKMMVRDLEFQPFRGWKKGNAPKWWSLHNRLKHRFAEFFEKANQVVVWESLAALYVLLNHDWRGPTGPMGTKVFVPSW